MLLSIENKSSKRATKNVKFNLDEL